VEAAQMSLNQIEILKKALMETIEQNDKLRERVIALENQVHKKDEELKQQDKAIAELSIALNKAMNGMLFEELGMDEAPEEASDSEEEEAD